MGRDGGGGRSGVQRAATRCANPYRNLWEQLRPGGRDRLIRAEVRIAQGDLHTPELLFVGTARLHRRKRNSLGRATGKLGTALRVRGGRWHRISSILDALRALHALLL